MNGDEFNLQVFLLKACVCVLLSNFKLEHINQLELGRESVVKINQSINGWLVEEEYNWP